LLSIPPQAYASFLSSILGDQVYAQNEKADRLVSGPGSLNSQTMALLEANVSSASILQDQNDKKAKKDEKISKNNQIDDSESVNIISENALMPITGLGLATENKDILEAFQETSVYVVRKGDSTSAIAQMFDVSVNTILAANNMKKGEKLVEGDVLLILPISGLEHKVAKGQTLQSIAKLYKADVDDIALYNGIPLYAKLAIGDELMIPDGVKAEENSKPVKNLKATNDRDTQYYKVRPTIQNLVGYFINPVQGYRKSQGIHDRNAIDMAIRTGTPIRASAGGRVTLARNGYNGGFGNLVILMHPNGVETLYAHMSKLGTSTGATVDQGEIIGYVGSTGRSTGPHLHFEVHGARNPGADFSWAN